MQVVLVSATLPHEILEMTNKFMTDPVRILVKRDELTLEVRNSFDRLVLGFFLSFVSPWVLIVRSIWLISISLPMSLISLSVS